MVEIVNDVGLKSVDPAVFETGNLPHISSGFVIKKKRVPTQR